MKAHYNYIDYVEIWIISLSIAIFHYIAYAEHIYNTVDMLPQGWVHPSLRFHLIINSNKSPRAWVG